MLGTLAERRKRCRPRTKDTPKGADVPEVVGCDDSRLTAGPRPDSDSDIDSTYPSTYAHGACQENTYILISNTLITSQSE